MNSLVIPITIARREVLSILIRLTECILSDGKKWAKMNEMSLKRRKSCPQQGKNYMLMGLGNICRGDDGIGSFIAQNFQSDDWLVLDCGTTPENFTSLVKRSRPEYLVIVDAAQMNLEPGEFRVIPSERIDKFYLTTHNIPLSLLICYLDKWVGKIILIGIQPERMEDFQRISERVQDSARNIIEILKGKSFQELEEIF
jgi:hydrogenase 3 maturation protease